MTAFGSAQLVPLRSYQALLLEPTHPILVPTPCDVSPGQESTQCWARVLLYVKHLVSIIMVGATSNATYTFAHG